jgi:hypothetical protein
LKEDLMDTFRRAANAAMFLAVIFFIQPAEAKGGKADVKKTAKVEPTKTENSVVDDFLLSFIYLMEKSPNVSPVDHLETSLLLTYECGVINNIDPVIGSTIVFHESWGIQDIRAKDTGDSGLMQIKPKFAVKPKNYEDYNKYFYLANTSTKTTEKKELQKLADAAYKKIYKDKFTIEELLDPAINVYVGCWALKMWRDQWHQGKKDKENYIAHYAGGTQIRKVDMGLQKYLKNQAKKIKKRFAEVDKFALVVTALGLFATNAETQFDNFWKKTSKYLVSRFPELKNINETYVADNGKKKKKKPLQAVNDLKNSLPAQPAYDDLFAAFTKLD